MVRWRTRAGGERREANSKVVCVPLGAARSGSSRIIAYGIVPSVAEEFLQHHYEAIAGDNAAQIAKAEGSVHQQAGLHCIRVLVPPLLAHIADSERGAPETGINKSRPPAPPAHTPCTFYSLCVHQAAAVVPKLSRHPAKVAAALCRSALKDYA